MENIKDQPDFAGNTQHLAILFEAVEKEDITFWNEWRNKNPEITPDLTGIDLREIKILKGIDFHEATLCKAIFFKSNLEKANFNGADCLYVDFQESILRNTSFKKASICDTNLIMADLNGADFENASIDGSTLMHSDLSNALLNGLNLNNTHLVNCNVTGITCKYIFIGKNKKKRVPENRDFSPDEVEKLFCDQIFVTEESIDSLFLS